MSPGSFGKVAFEPDSAGKTTFEQRSLENVVYVPGSFGKVTFESNSTGKLPLSKGPLEMLDLSQTLRRAANPGPPVTESNCSCSSPDACGKRYMGVSCLA